MVTQPRQPLITKLEPKSPYAAITSQKLGRTDHLLDGLDKFATGIGRGPVYDYSNPILPIPNISLKTWTQNLVETTLKSKDQFFRGAGYGPYYDYPNPLIPTQPIENKTWIDPLKIRLQSKDTFFGPPGMGPDYDYPNPRGPSRLAVYEVSGANLFGTVLQTYPVPYNQYDWPNPRGPQYPIDLRTFTKSLNLSTDTFYGLAGSPNYDWPVPKGQTPAISLKTWLDPLKLNLQSQDRFFGLAGHPTYDWPVPKGYQFPIDLRTYLDPLNLELINKDFFFGLAGNPVFDWPNPKGYQYPTDLRTWISSVIQITPNPFSLLDWPVPAGAKFPLDLRTFLGSLKLAQSTVPFLLTYVNPSRPATTVFDTSFLNPNLFTTVVVTPPLDGNIMPYRRHRRRGR